MLRFCDDLLSEIYMYPASSIAIFTPLLEDAVVGFNWPIKGHSIRIFPRLHELPTLCNTAGVVV